MTQQLSVPNTESELRETLDTLYDISKVARNNGTRPSFHGLLEIMSSEATIITAIHNIKSNHGSRTPGVDGEVMRKDYLERPYEVIVADIQKMFTHYDAEPIRRQFVKKPGKKEKRPLGIPVIKDRILQECMRIVLEPIVEPQFFDHSYGFRPMRDTKFALQRAQSVCVQTGNHWVVEGDISKCFDHINHTRLIKRLYHIGIQDRRVLQIIKEMMEAGIMGELVVNELGISQGGIISPLLANVYLDIMDEWITKQWEKKDILRRYKDNNGAPVRYSYVNNRIKALRGSNMHPAYLVRYADDFLLVTDTQEHAKIWKDRLGTFLQKELGLTLSAEKTLITNVTRKRIKFLGFELKLVKGKGPFGYVQRTRPDRNRLDRKVHDIHARIKSIKRHWKKEKIIAEINRINSQIRGLIQYYSCCTWVYIDLKKRSDLLTQAAWRARAPHGAKWIPANQVTNLPNVHMNYKTAIPAVEYKSTKVGVTSLGFCKWERTPNKQQEETPYTEKGRKLYYKRTGKKRALARLDELYTKSEEARALHMGPDYLYNFEYYMNRAYALNRDRIKCRVCGNSLLYGTPTALHLNPHLPLDQVNRVNNLVSVHTRCYRAVVDPTQALETFDPKAQKKIRLYRKKRKA